MLVYRSSERTMSAPQVRAELLRAIGTNSRTDRAHARTIEALLRASELECALTDAAHPSAESAAQLTDELAAGGSSERLRAQATQIALPDALSLKTPEGYAYYGLLPDAYAALARSLARGMHTAAVLGVRSIGTGLSAVVTHELREQGVTAERITLRPGGHPWDRKLEPSQRERAFITRQLQADATYLIVDEGPGMSGSTFLSVATALEQLGVEPTRIHLLCSHAADPNRLNAPHAAERFARYHCHAIAQLQPDAGTLDWSGGAWRAHEYADASAWPACWPQRERLKWLSADGHWLDKFEGLPPYGMPALERAHALAQLGYGPTASPRDRGFVRYAFLEGRPATVHDVNEAMLARYCAVRAREFACVSASAAPLEDMLRTNVQEALGIAIDARQLPIEIRVPTITDARMQPHEFRRAARGAWYKTDGHSHGDDHLLPGPTDIAWDLAGAMIEWRMAPAQCERLLSDYHRLSGDRPHARMPGFLAAYCALRWGELSFAAADCSGHDQLRARAAAHYYRQRLAQVLREQGVQLRSHEQHRYFP